MPIDFEESYTLGLLVSTISDLCKEHGTTIKALEKDLKFGNGTIRRWDTSKPAISAVVKVACYFNVSVDYLLGMSSYRKHETQNLTVKDIGLSEQTTEALVELSKSDNSFDAKKMATLNLLLEDDAIKEWGSQLLQAITDYLFAPEIPKRQIQFTSDEIKVIDNNSSSSDDPQSHSEYANVLYDRLLIDRVMRSIESARHQHRHPETMGEKCEPIKEYVLEMKREEASRYGIPKTESN